LEKVKKNNSEDILKLPVFESQSIAQHSLQKYLGAFVNITMSQVLSQKYVFATLKLLRSLEVVTDIVDEPLT